MNESSQETQETRRARRIIERLKMFNRKERDHLMKFALCEDTKAPEISTRLWRMISNGEKKPKADSIFIGMDYHLNWLYAALAVDDSNGTDLDKNRANKWEPTPLRYAPNESTPIQSNQEDVDLLVAWVNSYHRLQIVLIEAKLDSAWGSAQLKSKKERLTLIYEDAQDRKLNFIDWQLLLLSPKEKAPSKNEFGLEHFNGRYKWLRKNKGESESDQLWYEIWPIEETLPVKEMRRVGRVSRNHKQWTTSLSHRRSDPEDGSAAT